jgi:hypothetical protein
MSFLTFRRWIPFLCALVVSAGTNGVTHAQVSFPAPQFATEKATLPQNSATPQSKPQLEPKAIEIVKAACARLAAARSIEAGTIASYFNRSFLQY